MSLGCSRRRWRSRRRRPNYLRDFAGTLGTPPRWSRLTPREQGLGDETLLYIARELVNTVRSNVTIDWTLRENVRANLRRLAKRILRRHGYPPDKQEKATRTVLEQAELLSAGWAA